jgi:hypothetical protein
MMVQATVGGGRLCLRSGTFAGAGIADKAGGRSEGVWTLFSNGFHGHRNVRVAKPSQNPFQDLASASLPSSCNLLTWGEK